MKKKQNKNHAKEKRVPRILVLADIKRLVLGAAMFLMAVIMTLAFFNLAGPAGKVLTKVFLFLVGRAVFLIPLWFVLAALVFLNFSRKGEPDEPQKIVYLPTLLGILVLILGISGILNILGSDDKQGGFLGYIISWPLLKVFGFWASLVIFLAVSSVGGIIIKKLFKKETAGAEPIEEEKKKLNIIHFIGDKIKPNFKVKVAQNIEKTDQAKPAPSREEAPAFKVKKVKTSSLLAYKAPPIEILDGDQGKAFSGGDINQNSAIIKRTLENFGIPVEMGEVFVGPTVTQYTLKPAEGIKLSKITTLNNDLSLALACHPIRIEAPIPGKSLVGIEVPNKIRAQVKLKDLISLPNFQQAVSSLYFTLGRDVAGNPSFADLRKMPHLLIAGATGTGKTICLNSLIISLLYRNSPEAMRLILIDPKRVEFSVYENLPHLLCPIIYDAQKSVNALRWLVKEMERRFVVLSEAKTREISLYNELVLKEDDGRELLPYIILIIDELADLMASRGRDLEATIVRLAQMARAVGIHLVLATQRPSVEVITGLIKANVTSRVAFQVASQVDSRTILDAAGAEKLLGLGDLLFISAETGKPKRIQGAYISEKEVKKVAEYFKKEFDEKSKFLSRDDSLGTDLAAELEKDSSQQDYYATESGQSDSGIVGDFGGDPLYEEAKRLIIESKKASASLFQRRLRIGYARAARLLDILEEKGAIGPADGAKPREILIGADENFESGPLADIAPEVAGDVGSAESAAKEETVEVTDEESNKEESWKKI